MDGSAWRQAAAGRRPGHASRRETVQPRHTGTQDGKAAAEPGAGPDTSPALQPRHAAPQDGKAAAEPGARPDTSPGLRAGRQPEAAPRAGPPLVTAPGPYPGGGAARLLRRAWPPAAAAGGGLLLTLAFPPAGWWPLAPAAVALLTVALWQPTSRPLRRGAALGLVFGVVFCCVLLFWLHVIGPDAWLVLALVEALYFAPLGAGVAVVGRLRGRPVWAACLWVAEEAARGRLPLGGFTWGRLAFSQSASPLARYAALGGAPLLTFAVALAGCLLATLAFRPRAGGFPLVPRFGAGALAVALAAIGPLIPLPQADGRVLTVAVVQGNVPRLGLDFLGQRASVLHNHVAAMHELASSVRAGRLPRPDVVILPENSSDLDPYQDPGVYALINSGVRDVGAPTLVGAMTFTPGGRHLENRGIVWSPRTGAGAFYIKRHPVPFGEYVPLRWALDRFIKRFQMVPYDQVAGHRPGVLRLGPVRVGDVICFEVSYDAIVRDTVTHGGGVIVVQTNNADFGRTGQPQQQLAISRLRAVEHARPVLVAATSGISAIITADGRVLSQSVNFTRAILVQRVRASAALTLADRLGELPEWILTAAGTCAAALAIVWLRRNSSRRRQEV